MCAITLLTDFGLHDEYAGMMRGVIHAINPHAVVIDVTHHIDPQDVVQAAYMLKAGYRYFAEGSIHVVVVDPGVGGQRAIIALNSNGHTFIAPDNGVLSPILEEDPLSQVIHVENRNYFLSKISPTFHGRDIFAPVAAHLSLGVPLSAMGVPVKRKALVSGVLPTVQVDARGGITGEVIAVDRFGNLISNISQDDLEISPIEDARNWRVEIGGHCLQGIAGSYQSVAPGAPLAIVGSRGYLEIAVFMGHAGRVLSAGKGHAVRLSPL